MKKVLTLALLALGLMTATPAGAQVKLGVKGGLNVSDIHFSDMASNFDKKNRAGWFIGPTLKLTVPVTGLSFDISALYDYKSNKLSTTDETTGGYITAEETVKQQSIDVPVNVRYGWGLGSIADVFLFAGPQWAFNVGDKHFSWQTVTTSSNYSLRSTNFSVNVGLGVTALKHLQFSVNYNIACGKTADLTVWDAASTAYKNSTKGRNNSWQIAVGYYF